MHLTPAILEAAYNYLRATPPFSKWKLPESDAVEFYVAMFDHMGEHQLGHYTRQPDETVHRLEISTVKCRSSLDLIETMAHEMVHMHQFSTDRAWRTSAGHGPKFKRLADQVCKLHGFNRKTF